MTYQDERDERIEAAFSSDDDAPPFDAGRTWPGFVSRRTRQARRRVLARVGIGLAAAAALAGGAAWYERSPSTPVQVAAMFDSLQGTLTPEEPAMNAIQQATQHEIPQSLMPLLGHRTALRHDIDEFQETLHGLRQQLGAHPGDGQLKADIATVTEQLASAQAAMRIIDRQLAAIDAPSVPVLPEIAEAIAVQPDMPVIFTDAGTSGDRLLLLYGAGALLMLAWVAMTLYVRRTTRATINAMSAIQSQHSTLAAGIDAIAVEVERLGEGQRYMSRVLTGGEAEARVKPHAEG